MTGPDLYLRVIIFINTFIAHRSSFNWRNLIRNLGFHVLFRNIHPFFPGIRRVPIKRSFSYKYANRNQLEQRPDCNQKGRDPTYIAWMYHTIAFL